MANENLHFPLRVKAVMIDLDGTLADTIPDLAAAANMMLRELGRPGLEVDGGVKVDNIAEIARAGADTFVAGSAIFGTQDYKATIAAMRAELANTQKT